MRLDSPNLSHMRFVTRDTQNPRKSRIWGWRILDFRRKYALAATDKRSVRKTVGCLGPQEAVRSAYPRLPRVLRVGLDILLSKLKTACSCIMFIKV